MATILEVLQSACRNLEQAQNPQVLRIVKQQVHNSTSILEKGYGVDQDIDDLIDNYGAIDNIPDNKGNEKLSPQVAIGKAGEGKGSLENTDTAKKYKMGNGEIILPIIKGDTVTYDSVAGVRTITIQEFASLLEEKIFIEVV